MALKPTIYKFNITLSDLNRDVYQTIDLTLAKHPSETDERLMARVMAYCLNVEENLKFTKGLSEVDEPDVWSITLDDQISLWIDVGEPDADRIKKASHRAKSVKVYSFNSKSDVWWEQSYNKFSRINASFYRFKWEEIQEFAEMLKRTMTISLMITGHSAYITFDDQQCDVSWSELKI